MKLHASVLDFFYFFLPRAMLKGPKRSFALVLVVLLLVVFVLGVV